MTKTPLLTERDGRVAILTLNRPDKLNALDQALIAALDRQIETIEADAALRVVILRGAGGRAFSAGADIKVWAELGPLDMWRRWILQGNRLFDRIASLRQPVIAAIDGVALGGGLELALAADLRICSDRSRFALPETGLGTVPGWGGTRRLTRVIGQGRAKHMVLTGQTIDAARALAWGLVSAVTSADRLDAETRDLAAAIAARGPIAVQAAKRMIDAAAGCDDHHGLESFASAMCAYSEDGREGTAAFLDKRAPDFQGG